MSRAATTASNVTTAIATRGASTLSVAQAADIDHNTLRARLSNESEFTVAELVLVSGFLRTPLRNIITEAA